MWNVWGDVFYKQPLSPPWTERYTPPLQLFTLCTAPEPLSRLYTRNYYRVTWIFTALDAVPPSLPHLQQGLPYSKEYKI